ncbi:MAG: putative signal transducing protein [Planctomycetota bacterium]|jgi:DNA-directed RNA polymerase subunit M/transcription elongation factor TFIIS
MTDKLITIANFSEPFRAHLAKIELESEGIKCFLVGENFIATYWLLSNADRGIKLQVKESDAKRALEILETRQKPGTAAVTEDEAHEPADLRCPKCSSENIEYEKFSRKLFFLSILFLRFPLPFPKKSYRCENCGHVWKEP